VNPASSAEHSPRINPLLSGAPEVLRVWVDQARLDRSLFCLMIIVVGAGLYGAAVGSWRAPEQALYVAIKFPLILVACALGNALLNAIVAPLLGVDIGLKQSFSAILISFAIAAAILGSFSPITLFLLFNAPALSENARETAATYRLILLSHVAVIAFAGVVSNLRLFQLLREMSGGRRPAFRVLLAWLAGNLLLGSQLSWILRPFIGSPTMPVQFFRGDAFRGNFFETVFRMTMHSIGAD
jgi:hypothetical protein